MMAEYIDKEKLLKHLEETNTSDEWIVNQYNADWIYSFIESQPCADVVEVVRCKDCVWFKESEKTNSCYCDWHREYYETYPNDFCSYGERRSDAE